MTGACRLLSQVMRVIEKLVWPSIVAKHKVGCQTNGGEDWASGPTSQAAIGFCV